MIIKTIFKIFCAIALFTIFLKCIDTCKKKMETNKIAKNKDLYTDKPFHIPDSEFLTIEFGECYNYIILRYEYGQIQLKKEGFAHYQNSNNINQVNSTLLQNGYELKNTTQQNNDGYSSCVYKQFFFFIKKS